MSYYANDHIEVQSGLRMQPVSTVDALAATLRAAILDGEFLPGARLREVELGRTYGVARQSVRAALQALAHEGVVRHRQNHGAFVPEITEEDVVDLYRIRLAIETEAAHLVVETGRSTALIEAALKALAEVPRKAPWSEAISADLAVHQALVDAAGSMRMSRVFQPLVLESRLCLASLRGKDGQRLAMEREHRAIIDSLAAEDAGKAVHLLRGHLLFARDASVAALRAAAR